MAITQPSIEPDTIYMGAAHILFDTNKYLWAEGAVQVRLVRPELDNQVAGFGKVSSPSIDETIEVTFQPSNRINADILTFLYGSLFSAMPGASYFGSTDTVVKIHTMAGRVLTLANCKPTTFPALQFGVGVKRFAGPVTLTGILKRGTTRGTANALFTPWAALAWDQEPDEADYPQSTCQVTWGNIAAKNLEAIDAWVLTPQITMRPLTLPNLGTLDYRISEVSVQVSATPANLTEAELWQTYIIGTSRLLGKTVAGADLTLAEDNPGLTAVVKNAIISTPNTTFDPDAPIAGSCVWTSRRKAVEGVWQPAATLAVTAAPQG
jgi:hypothetical protein